MFKRILVPVDLTEKSMMAVDVAYDFAKQSDAEVILLHVIETIEHVEFDELKPFYERLEKSARQGLEESSEQFVSENLDPGSVSLGKLRPGNASLVTPKHVKVGLGQADRLLCGDLLVTGVISLLDRS